MYVGGQLTSGLHDQAGQDASLLLGEEEAAEFPLSLDVVQHLHLVGAGEADHGAREKIELHSEADAETTEADGREQAVGQEELLRVLAHVSELEQLGLDQLTQGIGGLGGVGGGVHALDLLWGREHSSVNKGRKYIQYSVKG